MNKFTEFVWWCERAVWPSGSNGMMFTGASDIILTFCVNYCCYTTRVRGSCWCFQ
jgi:hypothetical protein